MTSSPARRLRILTLTHNYPRFAGDPAGAFVARIAEGAAAGGHAVEVVAPHAPGLATEEPIAGVRVNRFRYAPESLERVAYGSLLPRAGLHSALSAVALPGFLLAFGHAVGVVARRFRPDLLHAHWWIPGGWFARRTALPYLITCHGSDVRLLEREALRRAARPVFHQAARVTAVSGFLAADLARLFPDLGEPVMVTPMPLDVPQFLAAGMAPKAEPPRVLYAGNLVPSKGVDVLVHAAAELDRRGVRYQLKVLGQGPELSKLQALAAELGISQRVTWSPFVNQAQMPSEYGASTVTVLPTRGQAEGLGLSLVEALLAGSAVVGTPAGGIPEVVQHERTGLLARDGDPLHLADQIQRLLADASLRERLTRAGKEYAQQTYSAEAAIGRILELYNAVTNHQPQR